MSDTIEELLRDCSEPVSREELLAERDELEARIHEEQGIAPADLRAQLRACNVRETALVQDWIECDAMLRHSAGDDT